MPASRNPQNDPNRFRSKGYVATSAAEYSARQAALAAEKRLGQIASNTSQAIGAIKAQNFADSEVKRKALAEQQAQQARAREGMQEIQKAKASGASAQQIKRLHDKYTISEQTLRQQRESKSHAASVVASRKRPADRQPIMPSVYIQREGTTTNPIKGSQPDPSLISPYLKGAVRVTVRTPDGKERTFDDMSTAKRFISRTEGSYQLPQDTPAPSGTLENIYGEQPGSLIGFTSMEGDALYDVRDKFVPQMQDYPRSYNPSDLNAPEFLRGMWEGGAKPLIEAVLAPKPILSDIFGRTDQESKALEKRVSEIHTFVKPGKVASGAIAEQVLTGRPITGTGEGLSYDLGSFGFDVAMAALPAKRPSLSLAGISESKSATAYNAAKGVMSRSVSATKSSGAAKTISYGSKRFIEPVPNPFGKENVITYTLSKASDKSKSVISSASKNISKNIRMPRVISNPMTSARIGMFKSVNSVRSGASNITEKIRSLDNVLIKHHTDDIVPKGYSLVKTPNKTLETMRNILYNVPQKEKSLRPPIGYKARLSADIYRSRAVDALENAKTVLRKKAVAMTRVENTSIGRQHFGTEQIIPKVKGAMKISKPRQLIRAETNVKIIGFKAEAKMRGGLGVLRPASRMINTKHKPVVPYKTKTELNNMIRRDPEITDIDFASRLNAQGRSMRNLRAEFPPKKQFRSATRKSIPKSFAQIQEERNMARNALRSDKSFVNDYGLAIGDIEKILSSKGVKFIKAGNIINKPRMRFESAEFARRQPMKYRIPKLREEFGFKPLRTKPKAEGRITDYALERFRQFDSPVRIVGRIKMSEGFMPMRKGYIEYKPNSNLPRSRPVEEDPFYKPSPDVERLGGNKPSTKHIKKKFSNPFKDDTAIEKTFRGERIEGGQASGTTTVQIMRPETRKALEASKKILKKRQNAQPVPRMFVNTESERKVKATGIPPLSLMMAKKKSMITRQRHADVSRKQALDTMQKKSEMIRKKSKGLALSGLGTRSGLAQPQAYRQPVTVKSPQRHRQPQKPKSKIAERAALVQPQAYRQPQKPKENQVHVFRHAPKPRLITKTLPIIIQRYPKGLPIMVFGKDHATKKRKRRTRERHDFLGNTHVAEVSGFRETKADISYGAKTQSAYEKDIRISLLRSKDRKPRTKRSKKKSMSSNPFRRMLGLR